MALNRVRLTFAAILFGIATALAAAPAFGQGMLGYPTYPTPVLDMSGRSFTVNGVPRFLLFVSYFDAMRRSNSDGQNTGDIDIDFAYIKAKGFDGIRIFPNWFHYQTGAQADDDGLFTNGSAIREEKWPVFLRVLNRAAANGLIVDVTFTRNTVSGLSVTNFGLQIAEVTARLAGAYPHVLFDLHNEYHLHGLGSSDIELLLNQYVRPADPNRLVTASPDVATAYEAGALAASQGLDLVAYHDPRHPDWYTDTRVQEAVEGVRSGLGLNQKPVYLQEPMAIATLCPPCPTSVTDTDPEHAWSAVNAAKRFGAAAWTFHTRSTFDLASTTFVARLNADPLQKTAFDAIRWATHRLLPGQSWPSPNGSYSLYNQGDGNVVLRRSDGFVAWASGTNYGTAGIFRVQGDGNLSHRAGSVEFWTANTWGNWAGTLVVQDDGRLVFYSASASPSPLWSSGAGGTGRLNGTSILYPITSYWTLASNDGRFRLAFQADGNLVLRNELGQITWQTFTSMSNPGKATFQGDGNLVVSDAVGNVHWSSGTWGNPGAYLVLENDGRLVLYSSGGTILLQWGG